MYFMENRSLTSTKDKKAAKGFGMDWTDEEVKKKVVAGAEAEGGRAVQEVTKDLEKMATWWNKTEWTMEERFSTPPMPVNMMVVRLASGGLLLYAPTRIREEAGFAAWLDSLGRVDWVVVASSWHTLSLPAVLARYPEARVVGAQQAEDKLAHVGALVRGRFDFRTNVEEELAKANEELVSEGVVLHLVKGDILANSVVAVAHGVALTCDLLYNRHDGGVFSLSKQEFDEFKDEHAGIRVFKYLNCNKPNSPNGFLAKYR